MSDVQPTRFHALATRRGFWIAMALLGAVSFSAATEFRRYAESILAVRDVIQQQQSVRSHSALNEIARLNRLLVDVSRSADADLRDLKEVEAALDTLHVRADHMARRIGASVFAEHRSYVASANDISRDAEAAITAIKALVSLADQALAGPDPFSDFGAREMTQAMETARKTVFRYLDQTTRMEAALLTLQSEKVLYLSRAALVFLAIVTLAGAASLHLLRREIVARHERERAERRADRLAYFDALTGLANRVQFQDKVDAFLGPAARGALVLLDLDGFKEINDRHGHAIGDAVLKKIARCIRSEAEQTGGFAARLGGDEFAIFMESDDTDQLMRFGRRLVQKCADPVNFGGTRVFPGVSVGIATTTQVSISNRLSYDHMMRVADFALYASKGAGRGQFTLYDCDLETVLSERRTLMKDLPKAIENRELEVFLQPKVLLENEAITGFEALVRWRRNGELLSPGRFIQIAEDSDSIREIDAYVLDRAIEIIADWNRRYRTSFEVSVNLSGEHFRSKEQLPFVAEALERHRFSAEMLTLEITETVQLESWDVVEATVSTLKDLGCRISIDDFGTGYSSLVYLRTISADELKIDKSLIDEIEESAEAQFILDAVIDLAGSLGLDVVVEGIERVAQKDFVSQLGCKSGQGYLFGRPAPASEALADATYAHPELKRVSEG